MRIGLDASRASTEHVSGTERYSQRIIEQMFHHCDQNTDLRLYVNSTCTPATLSSYQDNIVRIPQKRLWTHCKLRSELKQHPVDCLFVPAHTIPVRCPVPSVVTVHDLGYLHEPESHTRRQRWYLNLSTRHSVRNARRVIAISRHTRDDLVSSYGVDPEKIHVVYHGVDERFRKASIEHQTLNPPEDPYILFLGTIQPRKNIQRLIDAFELIADDDPGIRLILGGSIGWKAEPILKRRERSRHSERIELAGYVPDSKLPDLYRNASLFVLPSLYEGFGMPILEAMATGTPVIASNRGAIPEIAGNAALLFNPEDVGAMRDAMRTALTSDRRIRLIKAGHRWSSLFNWEKCGEQTFDILRKVAGSR